MQHLELKVPPPLVSGLFAIVMLALSKLGLNFELHGVIRISFFIFFVAIGSTLVLSALVSFKKYSTSISPLNPDQASSLVTTGIYKFSRNPMYLGLVSFLFGWGLCLGSLLSLFCVPIFGLYITYFQIFPEEKILTEIFGDDFEQYKRNVRRWL